MTSWSELARVGIRADRQALRDPGSEPAPAYLTELMADAAGPFVGVSDYMRGVQEQIRAYLPGTYLTLGTDGFGFSDTRPAARRFFNVDAESIVVAVLVALARDGHIDMSVAKQAADKYKIDDVAAAPEQTSDPGVA